MRDKKNSILSKASSRDVEKIQLSLLVKLFFSLTASSYRRSSPLFLSTRRTLSLIVLNQIRTMDRDRSSRLVSNDQIPVLPIILIGLLLNRLIIAREVSFIDDQPDLEKKQRPQEMKHNQNATRFDSFKSIFLCDRVVLFLRFCHDESLGPVKINQQKPIESLASIK